MSDTLNRRYERAAIERDRKARALAAMSREMDDLIDTDGYDGYELDAMLVRMLDAALAIMAVVYLGRDDE